MLTRSQGGVPLDADEPNLEVITGDVRNQGDLDKAVRDVTAVFHLARAPGGSWANYYQQDVAGTRRLAETCMAAGVRRLVYTGSIAVYNLARRRAITEQTPFDRAILRQNKYARAKAQAEAVLLNMHRACALPVVIVRPGIVIGRGGSLYHGGVGTWNGPGCCTFWGDGRGPLPLVLVEDVAHGLIAAADTDGVEGQSFNLVDMPCMTPRDYVAEIERFAGVRIQTFGIAPWRAYTADVAKWLAKLALRMPERYVPRYRMWKARMPIARFDCSRARQMLGWYPVSDRDTLVARGIHVHLIESAAAAGLEPVSAQQDEERA